LLNRSLLISFFCLIIQDIDYNVIITLTDQENRFVQ